MKTKLTRRTINELFHLVEEARRDLSGRKTTEHDARIAELYVAVVDTYPEIGHVLTDWCMDRDDKRGMWQVIEDELVKRGMR